MYDVFKMHTGEGDMASALGNTYALNMNVLMDDGTIEYLSGSFKEEGMTGARDAMVWNMVRQTGDIGADGEGWSADSYDPDFKKGFLMNLSENEQFDEMFPDHPLSELCKFVRFVIQNN